MSVVLALVLSFVYFLFPSPVSAHLPNIVNSSMKAVAVSDPEISKAYYDELSGVPRIYQIETSKNIKLYLNLLVPKNSNPNGRFSIKVISCCNTIQKEIVSIDGSKFTWSEYFEIFGYDTYLKGPELSLNLLPGKYHVIVFNESNSGKYALAVGNIEKFGIIDGVRAQTIIPKLKRNFFYTAPALFVLSPLGWPVLIASLLIGFLFGLLLKRIWILEEKKATPSACNLDKKGKRLRLLFSIITLALGVYLWLPILFILSGFLFWEYISTWCVIQAILHHRNRRK